jgi:hypothetical protein
MCGTCNTIGWNKNICKVLVGSLKEVGHLEDLEYKGI